MWVLYLFLIFICASAGFEQYVGGLLAGIVLAFVVVIVDTTVKKEWGAIFAAAKIDGFAGPILGMTLGPVFASCLFWGLGYLAGLIF